LGRSYDKAPSVISPVPWPRQVANSRMSYVPPIAPRVVNQGAYDAMRDKLRRVATYQRWVLIALLVNITISLISIAHAFDLFTLPYGLLRTLGLIRIPVCLFMTTAAFLLAKQFWHVGIAVLFALSMWIPFASLIGLLILSQKSTRILRQYGIKVGLLGTNPGRV